VKISTRRLAAVANRHSGPCSPEVEIACVDPAEKIKARHLKQVAGFWRRPIDSFGPAHSPAARAGLTIYVARPPPATSLTAGGVPPRRATSWMQHGNVKTPLR
jgi:hypothetical protein